MRRRLHGDVFPWHWIGIAVTDLPVEEILPPAIDRSHSSQMRIQFQGRHAPTMSRRFAEICALRRVYALLGVDCDWMVRKVDFPRVAAMPPGQTAPWPCRPEIYEEELLLTQVAPYSPPGYNPHPEWPRR